MLQLEMCYLMTNNEGLHDFGFIKQTIRKKDDSFPRFQSTRRTKAGVSLFEEMKTRFALAHLTIFFGSLVDAFAKVALNSSPNL
jgi:hypothetical protein